MNHGNAKKAPVITCPFQANTSTTSSHTMLNFMGCLAFGSSSSFRYTLDRPVWNSSVTTTIVLFMALLHEFHHRNGRQSSYRCHGPRSEEHTSELQSLRHLVCRL